MRKAHFAGRFLAPAALLNSYDSGFIVLPGLELDSNDEFSLTYSLQTDSKEEPFRIRQTRNLITLSSTLAARMKLSSTEYQKVLSFFLKAAREEPTKWSYWHDIGFCYGKLGQWAEAVAAFKRILDKTEATAPALNMLGHAHMKLENYHEAAIVLDKAHSMAPDNLSILYKIAVLHFYRQEFEMTQSLLQRIVHQNPTHLKAQYSLGLTAYHLNDQEATARQIASVRELNPRLSEKLAKIVKAAGNNPHRSVNSARIPSSYREEQGY